MSDPMKSCLTGNDLALAEQGVGQMLMWWRNQPGNSDFRREQIGAFETLLRKLSAINQFASLQEGSK